MPKPNEGPLDRAARLALGLLFGVLAMTGAGGAALGGIATALAVVAFTTAAVGVCPLYTLLGIDTTGERVEG